MFFFQRVVVRRGLIKHAFKLTETSLCIFGLLLSTLGLLPQLIVAAAQVLEQPLAFTRINR